MKTALSFYAFEPGAPGVPATSANGVYIAALVQLLGRNADRLDARVAWLRPAAPRTTGRAAAGLAALRWLAGEFWRLLTDRSRYLLFLYPKIPVLAHLSQPTLLSLALLGYRLLRLKAKLTGQRIVVIIADLPIEQAEGKQAAGGPPAELHAPQLRAIERSFLRAAHLIVTPLGYVDTIVELHGIEPDRFRTFRRNIYLPAVEVEDAFDVGFEAGDVNFFYSGAIDTTIAPNFRQVLRSIQNAPQARLHVCGPGREAMEKWLEELGITNARHYGQLNLAAHDWLAGRCDAGLILWPTDNPYCHLTPTSKYSAYLANGLAVLSTDLEAIAENIRNDGVGQAMPINELSLELLRWAARPSLFAGFKNRARQLADVVRGGNEMDGWIEEIAEGK
ncbi:MAG: hypothetical protein JSV86_22010 [Gemmatimonadota bacterium]|nr:MAG: hypothetical protein JSV86_22010 [Gemmatimonadota bacterium]